MSREIIDLLLEFDADGNATDNQGYPPARYADPDLAEELKSLGFRRIILDRWGESELHKAALEGDLERVKQILKEGFIPDLRSNLGKPPLMLANDHIEVVELLLQAGADPLAVDSDGKTVLEYTEPDSPVEAMINAEIDKNN